MTTPFVSRLRARFAVACLLALPFALPASAADAKKSYALPAGDAAATLKAFSEQSGEQIVYPVDQVRGVSTNAVSGEYTAGDALQKLLAGSGLNVVRDDKTGAYAITPAAKATTTAANAKTAKIPSKREVEVPGTAAGETIQMSPFEVNTEKDEGYLAQNALSGTRLNSKLEDISASLSVVTKQQLQDTAATDINDIFKTELGTEGIYQFTSFSVDRGTVTDDVQNNPTGATRMRGLTAANISVNGFTTTLPFDTYDIDSVEIARGPNSTVFGLGNTGGGVNLNKAKANVTREVTSFTTRGDSYDGYRFNFDINRPIYKNKLAVRLLGLYDEKGYVRKPSQDTTRRFQLAVTAKPFSKTTLNASFESYRNYNSRPNALTPRDTITDWVNNGRPTWDPITQTVNFRDGRPSITGITTALEAAQLPQGLAPSDSGFFGAPSVYIEGNGTAGLFMVSRTPNATVNAGPTNVGGATRLLQNGAFYVRNTTAYPLYNAPEITNRNLYDWTEVNLSAPNYATTRGETSSVQLDQTIFNTPRNVLAVQASWLYERIATYDRRFLGTGAALQPFIDVNEKLVDGTANPYFLRPYIGSSAPSFKKGWNQAENYRLALAYRLDLSHEQNILRWLGTHQFSAYGEYRAVKAANLGYQDTISSLNSWMGAAPASRNSTGYRSYPRYYVGDTNGYNVDSAPAANAAPPYTYNLRYYNNATAQWTNENVTFDEYYDANRPNRRILGSGGGVWQGFLLGGRIVPLAGFRKDSSRTRDGNSAINPTAATNGYYNTDPIYQYGTNDWVINRGKTTNEGIVVKPLSWLNLSYSQSNSFSPGSQTYNVFGEPLPDPHGYTKDYGFSFTFFDGKLSIVAKQYETADIGRSTSDLNTIVQRVLRMDRRTSSGDPGLTDFLQAQLLVAHPDWTQTMIDDETNRIAGVNLTYIRSHVNKTHGDASNSYSRGKEVSIIYNPTRYLRMKASLSQSNPINGILSPLVQEYIGTRMPTWTTVTDPANPASVWWTTKGSNGTIPRDFYINNVVAGLKLAVALQGKRRTQTSEYHAAFLTNYGLAGLTDNKWLKPLNVGGTLRWVDKASIGYLGAPADADGIVREFDPNKPVWLKAQYNLDLSASYRLRFFKDKVRSTIQLNVNNVFEDGRLQKLSVNPDGTPWAFRIIDPRQFILSVNFDL